MLGECCGSLWLISLDSCDALHSCTAKLSKCLAILMGTPRLQEEGSTEGKLHEKEEKKKAKFFLFFPFFYFSFFRKRDNKIYLLDRSILSTLVALTAVNISGLLLLSAYFPHWTVTAKYFLAAILSVLKVIHEKYPWNDWNRFSRWKRCALLHGKYHAEWRMPSPKKPSQGEDFSGKFLVDLYSSRWAFIQHSVGRGACGWCLACKCKLSLWVNQASSWAWWGVNEAFG